MKHACRRWTPLACLAAALTLGAAGCDSESVAPHQPLPRLSQPEIASQTAVLAAGIYGAADKILGYGPAAAGKSIYAVDLGNEILVGEASVEARAGGPDGVPCAEDDPAADWIHATGMVTTRLAEGGDVDLWVVFEFVAYPYDPAGECGRISGQGTLVAGAYTSVFTLSDIVTCAGDYPTGGWGVLEGGAPRPDGGDVGVPPAALLSARVDFDGTQYAWITAGGILYRANLKNPLDLHREP